MSDQPNIVMIIADDMNWDAVGAYGCPTAKTTPHIDRLASEGIRFNFAHVTVAVCQPSRSALLTGMYAHNSGGEGFFHLRYPDIPVLPALLKQEGYRTGILGKVAHSTPHADFEWDTCYDMQDLGMGRNPDVYRQHAAVFIRDAVQSGSPFFLMANSHDPHRPFYGNDEEKWYSESTPRAIPPSHTFKPEDVSIPGFLEDLPEVRLEISEYYNSVRRCDDTVGEILDELHQQGVEDNTIVVFLSDNGMAFPFAKTNCYLNSTRTPWIIRWPGVIGQNSVDNEHFVSGIDLLPTLLDAAGIASTGSFDGCSFLPVLQGDRQDNREMVFTQFHQTAGRRNYPMRCVQNRRFGYIFNPWSDGERIFSNESQSGRTFKAMQRAAEENPEIMKRVNLFLYRVPEELYDFQKDPDALTNLIADPDYAEALQELREAMETYMLKIHDPALEAFRQRDNPQAIDTLFAEMHKSIGGTSNE